MPELNYTFLSQVMTEVSIPEKGILSRTIQNDDWWGLTVSAPKYSAVVT